MDGTACTHVHVDQGWGLEDCPQPQKKLQDKKIMALDSKRSGPGLGLENHWPWP